MDRVAKLKSEDRAVIFQETGARKNLAPAIVEKDFWVCWVLGKIFASDTLSKQLMFKGGTSLSKAYRLIERFSEDIDLILDWRSLTDEDPWAVRSKTKQSKFNQNIQARGQEYIATQILPILSIDLGEICKIHLSEKDPNIIQIIYPASFTESYLRPDVQLEIGPLAIWSPNERHEITPYAAEIFPEHFLNPNCTVRVIKAERTFWEKITILHHEAHRPEGNSQPLRYSRHYYDLTQMANSEVKNTALSDLKLLESVVESKQQFYPRGWAKYELAKAGSMKLIPSEHVLTSLRKDYEQMKVMIFGDQPDFDFMMSTLKDLESQINFLSV